MSSRRSSGISWIQARIVLLADTGAEVGHGEHAAVQGVLRIGQVTTRVQTVEELPDRRGVCALVVGVAEVLAAVKGHVDKLGDSAGLQAGPLAGPAHPCGDHARQCVAVGVLEDDLGGHPVEQESGNLGWADPQRLAGVVVGSEVHHQPGTVPGHLVGQASRVRGREKLGDDGVAFGIVDLGHRLRRAVRLRHGPAARQGQRPELAELVADLRLPGGIGGGEPVLQQPSGPRPGRPGRARHTVLSAPSCAAHGASEPAQGSRTGP